MAESVLIHNVLLADRPSMPRGWVLVEGDTISAVGEAMYPQALALPRWSTDVAPS